MRNVFLTVGASFYVLMVFVLDAISPLGIEVWVLYLPVILLPVLLRSFRLLAFVSLASSVMVVLAYFISPPGSNPPSWDIMNRGMGLATIALTTIMAGNVMKKSARLDDALSHVRREITERDRISRVLEENEERLRLATEGAGMGIFDANLQTAKVVCSASYLRMLGYDATSDRETTIDIWRSNIHSDDLPRVLEAREIAQRHRTTYSIEYRIRRAGDGEFVWLGVFGRFQYNESGEADRFLGVAFDITRRKELEREVLGGEVLAIAAREQRQIGQELHDGVGQELTGLGLMAQSLAERLPHAMAEKLVAHRLVTGLDSIHQQVRELSRGLIPVHVESRGLSAALEDLAARTAETTGIAVTAECPESVELPDHATATQLFRIAQEAVSNAVRHGRPQQIRLTLLAEPSGLGLHIKDNGIGIRRGSEAGNGLGLRIMQYRAGQIGGVLQIGPSRGGGTVVSCILPGSNGNGEKTSGNILAQSEGLDRR
jgi:PAS domain S-box-containing protein